MNNLDDLIKALRFIEGREAAFSIRCVYNQHFPADHLEEDITTHKQQQVKRLIEAKQFYVANKERLIQEVHHETEREYIDMLEGLISDDLERAIFDED